MTVTEFGFTVEAEPQITERPRVTKNGTYTPKASLKAQAAVKGAFLAEYPAHAAVPVGEATFHLEVVFYRGERYNRDLDNLLKTVMDGLNGVLYEDDRQVTAVTMRAEFVPKGHGATSVLATRKEVTS